MIKTIELQNFQSHKNTKVELCPTVNVIEGSSNCGKSAILRALNWVISNRPTGESFRSNWALKGEKARQDDTYVIVEFDNGTVTRLRGPNANNYSVDGLVLDAIGTDVPERVSALCNFSEVNLQSQMDAPFLLSSSGADVARFFNKIVRLDLIDKLLSSVDSKKRKTKASIEMCSGTIKTLEQDLEQYGYINEAEKIISRIEAGEQETLEKADRLVEMRDALRDYSKHSKVVEASISAIEDGERMVRKIERTLASVQEKVKAVTPLKASVESYKRASVIVNDNVDMVRAGKLVSKVGRYGEIVATNKPTAEKLTQSVRTYIMHKAFCDTFETEHAKLHKQLPNACPLCGKEFE